MPVVVYLIAMIVILAVAAAVVGMVMVGTESRHADRLKRYPQLSEFLSRAAEHLNGEASESRGDLLAPQPQTQLQAQPRPRVRERV